MSAKSPTPEPEALPLPQDLQPLTTRLDESIHAIAVGDKAIQDGALAATKYLFDLAISSESQSQQFISQLLESMGPAYAPKTRSQSKAAAEAIHAEPSTSDAILKPTPLASLFVSDMGEDQIWAQLELKASNMCESLGDLFGPAIPEEVDGPGALGDSESDDEEDEDSMDGMEELDGMEMDSLSESGSSDDDEDMDEEEFEDEEGVDFNVEENGSDEDEFVMPHKQDSGSDSNESESEDQDDGFTQGSSKDPDGKRHRQRNAELDDDFFNLAEFNAETEEAESRRVTSGRLSRDDDDDDEEDEEEVDLFAPVDQHGEMDEGEEDESELFYKDFFKLPRNAKGLGKVRDSNPRRATARVRFNEEVRVKKIKGKGKSLPLSSMKLRMNMDENEDDSEDGLEMEDEFMSEDVSAEDPESEDGEDDEDIDKLGEDGRDAVERLKDDLFADEDEPQTDLTTFQQRQARIKEQIAQLEAENVAKKDWTLMGEVASRARPKNSLLEEDLEFERVMKVVPVVTEESVQGLESRIKARILANNFDDVVRRKPVDDKPFLPSRLFELQDTKSSQSLAQIYEEDFVAAQNGGFAGEDRDGKLKKEHEEIEKQWESICYKLDALCNAHFTPKQPKAAITTVTNVSAITLESALPTAKSSSAALAPEEVYAVNSNDLRARSELTPTEKQALRNKEKKRRKKQRQLIDNSVDKFARLNGIKGVKKQKEAALKSVVKSGKGVTVIGKKSQEVKKQKVSKKS